MQPPPPRKMRAVMATATVLRQWALLSAIAPRPLFDVIISSPPSFQGEPRDLADRAWHAGAGCCDILPLFDQARERLTARGRVYLLLSSDSDLDLFYRFIGKSNFTLRLVAQRSIWIKSLMIYELQPLNSEDERCPKPLIFAGRDDLALPKPNVDPSTERPVSHVCSRAPAWELGGCSAHGTRGRNAGRG